ncbi:MAG: hypothetical protein ACRD2B_16080 [Terriglobia bacterium]
MQTDMSALLLHLEDVRFCGLQPVLNHLSVRTARARTQEEVHRWLDGPHPPDLIFTHVVLPDGTWNDVVNAAMNLSAPVGVVVVSPFDDHMLYAVAMNSGAFDFIAPPFEAKQMAYLMNYALKRDTGFSLAYSGGGCYA